MLGNLSCEFAFIRTGEISLDPAMLQLTLVNGVNDMLPGEKKELLTTCVE
jgi:hypothetical protein